jgi:hypothetical protein
MAIWEEIKDGSTTFTRPTVKTDGGRNQTASELRDVAIRGLLGKLPGNWPIIADIGMHIMGPNTDAALAKGKDYLGNVVGSYWKNMGEAPARATYDRLTDIKGGRTAEGAERNVKGRMRPENEFLNPSNPERLGDKKFRARLTKDDAFLEESAWRRPFYENPEMTAEALGATSAAAPLIAGGLALSAFAEGGKPRSSYSNSVDGYDLSDTGSRSSNEYNPSVESAREAARAKTELENLKHAHKKELIELRGEAGTPGVQGGSSSVGSSGISTDVDRFLSNVYGSRGSTKYF